MPRSPDEPTGGPGSNQHAKKPRRGGASVAASEHQHQALRRAAEASHVFLVEPGSVDPGLMVARTALLDTLDRLGPQANALTLIGAQAVYERTSAIEIPELAPATGDADLAVDPDLLLDGPQIGPAMTAAGFSLRPDRPGIWIKSDRTVGVDFLVPDTFAGTGRRSAKLLRPQGKKAVGRAAGLELTVFDRELLPVTGLEKGDERVRQVSVAGHAALFCAKAHKLAERIADRTRPDRVRPKDAADMYRLMLAADPEQVRHTFAAAEVDNRLRETGEHGRAHLSALFGPGPGKQLVAIALGVEGAERERSIASDIAGWMSRFERRAV